MKRQFDGLADIGETLSRALNQPVEALWRMQNGYALCTRAALDAIAEHLAALQPHQLDALRGKLNIGIHRDVEVTMPQWSLGRWSRRPFARHYR
jgi:hypothetical protein